MKYYYTVSVSNDGGDFIQFPVTNQGTAVTAALALVFAYSPAEVMGYTRALFNRIRAKDCSMVEWSPAYSTRKIKITKSKG